MSKPTQMALKWVMGILLGLFFIWLSALDWPINRIVGEPLSWHGSVVQCGEHWSFDTFYLLPYFLILVAIHFLRVIRWKPLLEPLGEVDFRTLNSVSAIGFMYLFVLPFRLGELVRPYLLSRHTRIGMSESMATIVVERVVDGLIVSVILLAVLVGMPAAESLETEEARTALSTIEWGAIVALSAFGGAFTLLVVAYWARAWTIRILKATIGRISTGLAGKIIGVIEEFFRGLRVLPNVQCFAVFLAWSMLYWLLNGLGYFVLALGFAQLTVSPLAAYAMMCWLIVGMMLPNPPANVGVFWYFLLMPLVVFGVDSQQNTAALVFGLMAWLGQLVQQGAFGLWFQIRARRFPLVKSAQTHANTRPDSSPTAQMGERVETT